MSPATRWPPTSRGRFTTTAPPPPPPNEGPGGPILVVSSAANPFSRYYVEILRNEGLNAFNAVDISTVDATLLADYDVVILGEIVGRRCAGRDVRRPGSMPAATSSRCVPILTWPACSA